MAHRTELRRRPSDRAAFLYSLQSPCALETLEQRLQFSGAGFEAAGALEVTVDAEAGMHAGAQSGRKVGGYMVSVADGRWGAVGAAVTALGGTIARELGAISGADLLVSLPDGGLDVSGRLTRALGAAGGLSVDVVRDVRVAVERVPNDPSFPQQVWQSGAGTGRIDATGAWDLSTGNGVVIAVVDTGVSLSHPDLRGKIFTNPREVAGNRIDDDRNGYIDDTRGWDFVNRDNTPDDDQGHGTHVAGIAAAAANNGIGVAGVGYNATILPLKFLGADGSGSFSDAVAAWNYVAGLRQAGVNVRVVNNSWGGEGGSVPTSMSTATERLRSLGVVVVNAAGNGGSDQVGDDIGARPYYPGSLNNANVLTVAASDSADKLARFSNYSGGIVDVAAPGVGIYSTLRGGGYGNMSGTSMASPMVSGTIALMAAAKPAATADQLAAAVRNSVDRVSSLTGKVASGGRLNARKAVSAILSGSTTVPTPPTPIPPAPTPTPTPTPPATAPGVPSSPTNLVAIARSGVIDLGWRDNSAIETHYYVLRSTNGGSFRIVALLGANATRHTDRGVIAGTRYDYRVRAVAGSVQSADSNTASVLVPASSVLWGGAAFSSRPVVEAEWSPGTGIFDEQADLM